MSETSPREEFDTGLNKIRVEIKTRLVPHGLFGRITEVDIGPVDGVPAGSQIEIAAKGRMVARTFNRRQIEDCRLRVSGVVLSDIIAMINELSV
jgi:hypothetical protein